MTIVDERSQTPKTVPIEKTMRTWDGVELFYRAWLPEQKSDRAVILFHRGHEHSGRLADVVEGLKLDGVAAFAWDARGHGRSPGERGFAPSFGCMVRDVDCFVRYVSETYDIPYGNIVVVAHSVGAVTVATWVHDYAPPIRAMALATPALRVKLYVPFAIPGLRLMQWFKPGKKSFITSYVKAKMLTHDSEQAARYDSDPLIAKTIAVNILLGLYDASSRLIEDAGAIRVPTLLLAGGADWVVKISAEDRFFDKLGAPVKRMRVFDNMYHDVLHEKNRELVWEELRQFVRQSFDHPAKLPSLLAADYHGYTYREYERLSRKLHLLSPRRWYYALARLSLNTGGRLSNGIRIGWRTGFDSGQSLDYVYENRPQGWLGIGKLIDWFYLNGLGWTGIRQRKINLEKLLKEAIGRVHDSGEPVRILDVATGCGRYVLDTLAELRQLPISALLRDWTPANLEVAKQTAARLGLKNLTFEPGDAFDRRSLASVQPTPNVAIVSGLYELFPSNTQVLESLRGIADAMQPGGYLIYTGQPWHPQIEMIARVLPNRVAQQWVMRRRTQEEMDQLVAAAGFEKIAMEIDEMGIFTVSLARRLGHSI
jgi:alpha-beta hydrolase superfamily lysophospholipase/SAM-dependent methyltransferase